jgi:hypothetical protein
MRLFEILAKTQQLLSDPGQPIRTILLVREISNQIEFSVYVTLHVGHGILTLFPTHTNVRGNDENENEQPRCGRVIHPYFSGGKLPRIVAIQVRPRIGSRRSSWLALGGEESLICCIGCIRTTHRLRTGVSIRLVRRIQVLKSADLLRPVVSRGDKKEDGQKKKKEERDKESGHLTVVYGFSHGSILIWNHVPSRILILDSEPVVKYKPRSFAAGLIFILNGKEYKTQDTIQDKTITRSPFGDD